MSSTHSIEKIPVTLPPGKKSPFRFLHIHHVFHKTTRTVRAIITTLLIALVLALTLSITLTRKYAAAAASRAAALAPREGMAPNSSIAAVSWMDERRGEEALNYRVYWQNGTGEIWGLEKRGDAERWRARGVWGAGGEEEEEGVDGDEEVRPKKGTPLSAVGNVTWFDDGAFSEFREEAEVFFVDGNETLCSIVRGERSWNESPLRTSLNLNLHPSTHLASTISSESVWTIAQLPNSTLTLITRTRTRSPLRPSQDTYTTSLLPTIALPVPGTPINILGSVVTYYIPDALDPEKVHMRTLRWRPETGDWEPADPVRGFLASSPDVAPFSTTVSLAANTHLITLPLFERVSSGLSALIPSLIYLSPDQSSIFMQGEQHVYTSPPARYGGARKVYMGLAAGGVNGTFVAGWREGEGRAMRMGVEDWRWRTGAEIGVDRRNGTWERRGEIVGLVL